ncbi:carbohydrate-binding module family 1 protein [Lophiostoma macrostomum CBS 122681]|uniref:alpha-galactosidase n=1 Tax=Lophiostoma macrostomum CBS 122681 TaxID=1314788 RepID=A0A6A6SP75_9PLEO|nr:carbohydrate-binding module family 1 protein [Lophiostoma macrostomum CBS 122681]
MAQMCLNLLAWVLWVGFFVGISLGQATFTRGQKWQIILLGTPDMSKMPLPPTDAQVWDIDLFDNDASAMTTLKAAGKTVICYFSAGTWEDWRDDAKDFASADLGKVLPLWPNEKWLKVSSTKVRDIMAKRIKLAADKGCDAIDPDNTDGYQNDNGLNLKDTDAIDYVKWIQKTAAGYGMKTGLKNSLDILPSVSSVMDFAVNEQCAQLSECNAYDAFLASNKPVFQIEYPVPLAVNQTNGVYCKGPGTAGMSTVLKDITLDGETIYCDGSRVDTPTKGGTRPTPTTRPGTPHRTSTPPGRPTSTFRPTTTIRPTSAITTSAQRPTSSAGGGGGGGGGGGCTAKHWDQCGGNNWNGCTTCASPYTCKGVSPPYYYQCL